MNFIRNAVIQEKKKAKPKDKETRGTDMQSTQKIKAFEMKRLRQMLGIK